MHLNQYATEDGLALFVNGLDEPYTLIGFDANKDPEHPTTGHAYVPAYATDSVIAVREEDKATLYAMWEPKIYVTFVNTTDEDITVQLSGTGTDTVRIVNRVNGKYERVAASQTITVPAKSIDTDGRVMIVLPTANTRNNETFTATAVNNHEGKTMSVSGAYHDNPHGTGSEDIPFGYPLEYTGTLSIDENGVIVTYTEEPDASVEFDINGADAVWNETSEYYNNLGNGLHAIEAGDIARNNNQYEPADPSRPGMAFIGWTTNQDIAETNDFSATNAVTLPRGTVIIPDEGSSILEKVRQDFLWDFSRPSSEAYDVTLYAVWAEAVTVTFDLVRTGSNLHVWQGPETTNVPGAYAFYRSDEYSSTVTYTLLKGECVPKPADPRPDPEKPDWYFVQWMAENDTTVSYRNNPKDDLGSDTVIRNNAFDFSKPITDDVTLVTSWTTRVPQMFTFHVENHVIGGNPNDEFEYTIAVSNEKVDKSQQLKVVDNPWGSVTTNLKNNERYTVRITVRTIYAYNSNDNFGGHIEVIDRDGRIVKSEVFNKRSDLGQKYYSSSYQLDLSITQTQRSDYETSVAVENVLPEDSIAYSLEQENRAYVFKIRQGKYFPTQPENVFVPGASNSLTVIFTNTGEIYVAPTGFSSRYLPYILMLEAGLILMLLLGCAGIHRRQGKENGEEAETDTGLNGIGTGPPERGRIYTEPIRKPKADQMKEKGSSGSSDGPEGRGDPGE